MPNFIICKKKEMFFFSVCLKANGNVSEIDEMRVAHNRHHMIVLTSNCLFVLRLRRNFYACFYVWVFSFSPGRKQAGRSMIRFIWLEVIFAKTLRIVFTATDFCGRKTISRVRYKFSAIFWKQFSSIKRFSQWNIRPEKNQRRRKCQTKI